MPDVAQELNGGAAQGGASGGKRKSPQYPYFSLAVVVRLIEAIENTGGNSATFTEVAKDLGLNSIDGGNWTYRLSSAREFGLVERSARGEEKKLFLTDLARRILRPGRDGERETALLAAFFAPEIYKALVKTYEGAAPKVEMVKNELERSHGLLETVSGPAANAFIDSARYVGILRADGRIYAPEASEAGNPPIEALSAQKTSPAPEKLPSQPGVNTDGWLEYPVALRPGVIVTFKLPTDLKKKDVDRLHRFLSALPFDDGDE